MNSTAEEIRKTTALNIQNRIELLGISKKEFAKKMGVSQSIVSCWALGQRFPRNEQIEKMCRIFGCTPADLMLDDSVLTDKKAKHRSIPLYGEISAGNGFFSDSNIERYVAVDESVKADFAVVVRGDSMDGANIHDGDVALLSKDYRFADGKIFAVWKVGEELSYLKRVYLQGNKFLLSSENPMYAPIIIENNEAIIVGELCGIYHRIIQ
jgi:repressor LexA